MDKYKQTPVDMDGLRLPDSRDLECQVLADLVSNPEMLPTVRSLVNRNMFTTPGFQRAWDTLNEMVNQGTTVDMATIGSRVDRQTLMAIIKPTPGLSLATMDHCRALVEVTTRRFLFSRAYEIMSKAGNAG